ncbi:hypothetical protein QF030_007412 [Streptomyces rishiriensis]|uniref:Uncharacterized protein n=1 Tax=Streptomyces rishiriensis TaxID=68264 RepID=A0ABU0P1J7_STRRH|nr:hypothetical protein [Streptomyces rishiriensis]MDQ0585234.1 hypothetical protein [Streptomyces rishiriensis]
MKLLRVGPPGEERPAVRVADDRLDPSSATPEIDGAFLSWGGVDRARAAVEAGEVAHPDTGTPAGVALGLPGTPHLRPGDTVELEIDGLGGRRQTFGQA